MTAHNKAAYVANDWREVFGASKLFVATDWWRLAHDATQSEFMDEVNYRYGGESFVCRTSLAAPHGGDCMLYIKCQLNQRQRTLRHPLRGVPTLDQEYRVLRCCEHEGIAAAQPLFFDSKEDESGNQYTVLVILGLTNHVDLDELDFDSLPWRQRQQLIADTADAVLALHEKRLVHHNLYGKHIFVCWREKGGCFDVRFIDMEKSRKVFNRKQLLRDLDSLSRRTAGLTVKDRIRFLQRYLGVRKLDAKGKAMAWELNGKLGKFLERKG